MKDFKEDYLELLSLVNGAKVLVELFGYDGSPGQKEWAKNWLAEAKKHLEKKNERTTEIKRASRRSKQN